MAANVLEVTDSNFDAEVLKSDVPVLVEKYLAEDVALLLDAHQLDVADITGWVCHPGGPKVIEACEEAFVLPPGTLDAERAVLRDFGNMSAVSVLFVLERVLARASANNERWQRALMTAFGPGFTAGFVLIQNA